MQPRTLFVYQLFNQFEMVCGDLFRLRGMEYPRCSTALDGSLDDVSLEDEALRFANSDEDCENDGSVVNTNLNHRESIRRYSAPLLKLKEMIESLRLDSPSTPHESDSDYTSLTASSDASLRFDSDSNTRRSDVVGLEASLDDLTVGVDDETGVDNNDSSRHEPESGIVEQFRQFGLRLIRKPGEYSHCKCPIPEELLQYHEVLSEVAGEVGTGDLPPCFKIRWAECRQNFEVDVFGDLHFQDFLLGREQRGPYHAMVHFGNVFANIGYEGTYWYWTLVGNASRPFIEDKFRNKENFINSFHTMVRHHMRTRKVFTDFEPTQNHTSAVFNRCRAFAERCFSFLTFFSGKGLNAVSTNFTGRPRFRAASER